MLTRRISAQLIHSIVSVVFLISAAHAGAAEQVFDVDETTSTFSSGSVEVEFNAVAYGAGWLPQFTSGTALIENAVYQADGTITLDLDASTVTLQDLQIGGDVGVSGSGELDYGIFTMDILYQIISRALALNAPVTVPLVGGAFSATPNFEFSSVLNGHVSGLLVNYDLPEHQVGGDADVAVSGTLTTAGSDLLLDLSASQMQIDLGGSPTVTVEIQQCAVRILGICYFFMEKSDVTITQMTYHDVQMNLAASSPMTNVCGDGILDPGEDCDDNNTNDGDCCSSTCQFEADGSVCNDDGDVCNGVDTCDGAGTCEIGTPLVCDNGDLCDGAETCDPLVGCQPGTPLVCDNGNVCDGNETCDPVSGCQPGTSLECDDGDDCTADSCDEVAGCINDPIPGCGASVPSMSGRGLALLSLVLLAVGGRFLLAHRRFRA